MTPQRARYWGGIGALCGMIVLVELALKGADLRLWGGPEWRSWAYLYLSFQPRFLEGFTALWPGQGIGMFVTHSFLHIGLLHMASNSLALILLAYLLRRERSLAEVLSIFLISAIAGAALFAALAPPLASMAGASGALSGLSVVWAIGNTPTPARNISWQSLRVLAWITLLILLIEVLPGSRTAWQAHLGGAIAGALFSITSLVLKRKS